MSLRYETAIATFIQFISLSLLNIFNAADSIITTCHTKSHDCISNTIVSTIFFILIALWFGAVWGLGWFVQHRRSRRLAYLLMAVELAIIFIALFNIRHHNNLLNVITSVVDIGLSLWVILLAYRLARARGGRIVRQARGHSSAR